MIFLPKFGLRMLQVFIYLLLMVVTTSALAQSYSEAPMLAEEVTAGNLPPVAERLPETPAVVEPVESIGQYGGDWNMTMVELDNVLLIRTIGYDALVRWNPGWTEVIPNLAKSFEVNDDATAYTFQLREGHKWSDGAPFTADDIMFWYEAVFMNEELTPSQGDNPPTVEKLDDYTVRFTFEEPNGLYLQEMASPNESWAFTAFPRHYMEQYHIAYNENATQLATEAGFDSWAELFGSKMSNETRWDNPDLPTLYAWKPTTPLSEGSQYIVERNPYYFKVDPEGNQLPYLDRVVYRKVEDEQVAVLQALNGEIDMQDRRISALSNKAVFFDNQEQGNYHFYDVVSSTMNTMVLMLNLTSMDPVKRRIFQNKDFRIGLSHALDRQEIIDTVYVAQGEPSQAAPRPESQFYNEQLAKQYTEYSVDLANEHLDKAFPEKDAQGFRLGPDGKRIAFTLEFVPEMNETWTGALELVQGYWREVGVDMQLRAISRDLNQVRTWGNQHDATAWGGSSGLQDAIIDPRYYVPSELGSLYAPAWAVWFDPGLASSTDFTAQPEEPPAPVQRQMKLLKQLGATADEQEQADLMSQILDITAEQFYTIGISLEAPGYGIVKNTFHNVPTTMPGAWIYPNPGPTNPQQYYESNTP